MEKFPNGTPVYKRGSVSFFGTARATAIFSNGERWVLCESLCGTMFVVLEEDLRLSKTQQPLVYSHV